MWRYEGDPTVWRLRLYSFHLCGVIALTLFKLSLKDTCRGAYWRAGGQITTSKIKYKINCETFWPVTSRWLKFFTWDLWTHGHVHSFWQNHVKTKWKGHCTICNISSFAGATSQTSHDHNINHKLSNVSEECKSLLWNSFNNQSIIAL